MRGAPRATYRRRVHALVFLYGLEGATAAEHGELCEQLAPAFAAFPGLRAALWLTSDAAQRYGVVYVFHGRSAFDAFVASELFEAFRSQPSIVSAAAFDFVVSEAPTEITHGLAGVLAQA
jgi:hypothetical protein